MEANRNFAIFRMMRKVAGIVLTVDRRVISHGFEFLFIHDCLSVNKLFTFCLVLSVLASPGSCQTEGDTGYDYRDTDHGEFDEFAALGKDPSFDVPHASVKGKLGDVALLRCSIDYLGKYKVAWLDNNSLPLTYEDRRVIDDFRFSVVRPMIKDWHLQIRDLRIEDSGYYRCTVNTRPVINKLVRLTVTVPPRILEEDTSGDTMIKEGHNVTLRCNATGVPPPRIAWYRRPSELKLLNLQQSGNVCQLITSSSPWPQIQPTVRRSGQAVRRLEETSRDVIQEGHVLRLYHVTRYCDDIFECVADNDVNPSTSRRIRLTVEFRPEIILPNRRISQSVGRQTILECTITAYPQATNYWEKDDRSLTSSARHKTEAYDEGHHTLTLSLKIIDLQPSDFGEYKCVASNPLGRDEETMQLVEHVEVEQPLRQSRYWVSTSHPLDEGQAVIVLPPIRVSTSPIRSQDMSKGGLHSTAASSLNMNYFLFYIVIIIKLTKLYS